YVAGQRRHRLISDLADAVAAEQDFTEPRDVALAGHGVLLDAGHRGVAEIVGRRVYAIAEVGQQDRRLVDGDAVRGRAGPPLPPRHPHDPHAILQQLLLVRLDRPGRPPQVVAQAGVVARVAGGCQSRPGLRHLIRLLRLGPRPRPALACSRLRLI